ncbi:MAG: N-acetylmuramoyl-L-alanine amidase [Dethiosulfatibacter sp.]|nr:N-acetylmuramoyl-L-alanine amidase [Dethiosulfatibacter sp.]
MKILKILTIVSMIIVLTITSVGCTFNEYNAETFPINETIDENIVPEPNQEEVDVKNDTITIVLDPGHGGTNTGATADVNGDGIIDLEKDLNLIVASYMMEILKDYKGLHVASTRYSDVELSHAERAAIAQSYSKETLSRTVMLISIHNNANPYTQSEGVEAFVSVFDERYDWISTDIAYVMVDAIVDNFELLNRGVFTRASRRHNDWYGIIRNGIARDIPVIILEQAFIDNPADAFKALSSDEKLYRMAETNAFAIVEFFGLEIREELQTINATE